jgi:hypothetical protein
MFKFITKAMKLNERLLAKFATDYATADREGFLLKKGEVNKGFQNRFFVLRGNLLFYFEKKQDREPVGVIILDNCRIELCPNENSLFAFQIVFEGVGTRTYVLAAETEASMKAWMTKLTHAGHICIRTIVNDLERRLSELQLKEASMAPEVGEVFSESSSESDKEETATSSHQQTLPIALPKPPSRALQRDKSKTLPPRRIPNKQVDPILSNPKPNRWSLSAKYPVQTSESFEGKKQLWFDNLANFSERTDFLCEDTFQPGRHFSMTAFTPPSFSELKNHEEIEDRNLIDLSPADGGIPLEKKFDITLTDRFKGSRRAKSERHRIKRGGLAGARRDVGGSFYTHKKRSSDDLILLEENHDSTFQHLHRLWGATIWTKVREYEIQNSKPEAEGSSFNESRI